MTHIAISGDIGSGKSSVAQLLSEALGYGIVTAGGLQRSIAASIGLSTLEANKLAEQDSALDGLIDEMVVAHAQQEIYKIFDSRLAWHLIPSAFKIHLIVDPDVAARRILRARSTEVYQSLEEARTAAEGRYQSERKRFMKIHGVDVSRLKNYDLIVDSSDAEPQLVAAEIMSIMKRELRPPCQLRISPRRVIRTGGHIASSEKRVQGDSSLMHNESRQQSLVVRYQRPRILLVSGSIYLDAALKRGQQLMSASLDTEGSEIREQEKEVAP